MTLVKSLLVMILMVYWTTSWGLTVKIATMAPEGTTWGDSLRGFAKDVKKKTNGKVRFKIYYGGVAGDEPDVLRKIRIGQMHGGVFTGRALGDINGDVRAIELPFTFHANRKKAWSTLEKASAFFNKGFTKGGFKNLAFFEIGLVYVVSTKKADSLDGLKGLKIWSWEGDKLVAELVESMKLVSVPLALPDVLSSLTTGIIDAAYSSPLGVLALQWHTKIKYLIDFPVTFSVGAFLISNKKWNKIPKEWRRLIEKLATEHISKANKSTVKENVAAMKTLAKLGVEFISFPESDIKKGVDIRKDIIKRLKGKLFSAEALSKVSI